jgi:ribosomal protein S18 acetylase RimI-like enzyme
MFQFRPATSEDAAAIARIFLESAEYHARLEPERYGIPDRESVIARYRARARQMRDGNVEAITLLAVIENDVVGFVDAALERSPDLMHRDLTYCHIVEIAVALSHQSQGVGERLLTAAEEWGRERGADLASLEFLAANTRAGAFYQRRMGYRVVAHTAVKPLG